MRSLNQFQKLRLWLVDRRRKWLHLASGVEISPTAAISLSARFIPGRRGGIVVGELTQIAFKTLIIARDTDGTVRPVRIGARCFIGGGVTILPGVTIGNCCLIGAGAVVHEDMPPNTIVAGNPARVVRRDVELMAFGRQREAVERAYGRSKVRGAKP